MPSPYQFSRRPRRCIAFLGVSLLALLSPPALAVTGSITNIGTLGGTNSYSYNGSLSADGTVVVGNSIPTIGFTGSYGHAFRWTQATGMVDLGTLSGTESGAQSVSADGSVVVGWAYLTGDSDYHAFRWTQATGMVDLGTLGGTNSWAFAISADGSVVAGSSGITGNSADHAFRWTQSGGMVDLGTLGGTFSRAMAISADGNVAAGYSRITGNSATRAYRWTQTTGMVDLGTLGGTNSYAYAISADGNVLAGESYITGDSDYHAFRWTQAGGMVDLGTLGGNYSWAYGISANGDVVVGSSSLAGDSVWPAFRWTQATGMADLNTLLTDAGVDLTGIVLEEVAGISANGQIMAVNANGYTEVYVVRYIDATVADPEPAPAPTPSPPVAGPVITPIAGITTGAAQQQATQQLAAAQRSTLVENRSSASALLGMTRPMSTSNYSYAGGMFGSAVGYTGAQYSANDFTILGGFAYGSQDYPGVKQDAAVTIAAALRYSFPDPFGDNEQAVHPFFEVGGWLTPRATLALTRTYANGSGTASGTAATETTSGSFYGRLGMTWQITPDDQLVGYTELGQQYMQFDGYSEELSSTNPFPASVQPGLVRFGVMRAGGSWTHSLVTLDFDDTTSIPLSVTLAGAAARSFAVHSGLSATISGVGQTTASNQSDTWGEFGTRLQAQLTDNLGVNLDLNGTSGGPANRTSLHGGVGVSLSF